MKNSCCWIPIGIFFIVTAFIPTTSFAKGLVEPYLGMGKLQVADRYNFKDISDGFLLGVRMGVFLDSSASSYSLGLDYQSGGPFFFGALMGNTEWDTRNLGLGGMLHFRDVRFWAYYLVDNKITVVERATAYSGPAFKYGFGILANGKISVNLEVIQYQLNKIQQGGTVSDFHDYNVLCTNFTLSVPY